MLFSERDIDALRLLCWCQYVCPEDLSKLLSEEERDNLGAFKLIRRHEKSGALALAKEGLSLLTRIYGTDDVPKLSQCYRPSIIQRRLRLTSAEYISKKCGKVTISVTNNQMPLMPLFSPIYSSTRPYSQTRSNMQRDLMLPDEILRLDRRQCIALFQGRKPALLYKLGPEELPDYNTLKSCKVIDYIPAWKRREDESKKATPPPEPPPEKEAVRPPKEQKQGPKPSLRHEPGADALLEYDIEDVKQEPPQESEGNVGIVLPSAVRGVEDEDEDIPPGR